MSQMEENYSSIYVLLQSSSCYTKYNDAVTPLLKLFKLDHDEYFSIKHQVSSYAHTNPVFVSRQLRITFNLSSFTLQLLQDCKK